MVFQAHNVEYRDPIEEEDIIEEDHEQTAAERLLVLIAEQLTNWSRLMDLARQKELAEKAEKNQDDSDSSSDDEDFDGFVDWRSKTSYSNSTSNK